MNRVLAVRGQVVPATGTALTMHARLHDGTEVEGQSLIARLTDIDRVWVTPEDVRPAGDALRAIADADVIVLGPGSLFTSLLPALLVPRPRPRPSPRRARWSCSPATWPRSRARPPATTSPTISTRSARHGAAHLPDVVLANNRFNAIPPEGWHGEPVRLRWPPSERTALRLVLDDLVDPANAHHHDPERLAAAIIRAWEAEGGRRRRPSAARIQQSA